MTDALDNEIYVGDTVVYPGRSGSSMWINKSIVLEVNENTLKVETKSGRKATITRIDRVVIIRD